MLKIVFFGSSDFSLPSLKACRDLPGVTLAAVVTTPPQKQGRGLLLTPTPVAQFCESAAISFFDFSKLDDFAFETIELIKPDILVVASYGKMIPERFLKLAQFRFNVHPSLLPKYRGAAPLNWPILNGDYETGLSIADITKDLDAGDIYFQEKYPMIAGMTSERLGVALAEQAFFSLRTLLEKATRGFVEGVPQDHAQSTYARKLKKEDGELSFRESAIEWERKVRGLQPWPGTFAQIHVERVAFLNVRASQLDQRGEPGKILKISDESMTVQTTLGALEWLQVKPAGKKAMSGGDYARGRRWQVGMLLA